jgi:hypothetical protein
MSTTIIKTCPLGGDIERMLKLIRTFIGKPEDWNPIENGDDIRELMSYFHIEFSQRMAICQECQVTYVEESACPDPEKATRIAIVSSAYNTINRFNPT